MNDEPGEVKLRRATIGDAGGFETCIRDAYARYARDIPDLPEVAGGIVEDITAHQVWVAVTKDQIIGGLVLILAEEHMILANIAVAPSMTGQGVGRALMAKAEHLCREHGMVELRLSTHAAMPDNVRLYEHLGWRETGRDGNKVHMAKMIGV